MSLLGLGKRLSALAFAFIIISFLAGAQTASAHTATLNGGSSVDSPTDPITVSVDINLDAGAGVKGIQWWFDSDAPTCADISPDYLNESGYHQHLAVTSTFTIPVPTTPGTHSFYYKVTNSDDCQTFVGSLQNNGLTVTIPEPPPAPVCSTGVGSPLLVDVTQNIANDPDSSVPGPTWALDTFTRHIQIWQEGEGEGMHYCGQADDNGTFATIGGESGISPQSGDPLPNVITGTMVGGTHGMLTGSFNSEAEPISSPDCSVEGECSNLTDKWVKYYFGELGSYAYSPSPADSTGDWGWTYDACGHGTWVNANSGNLGDIVAEGDDCQTELTCPEGQVIDQGACVVPPEPHRRSSRGGTTNPNGGQVLGVSTETPAAGQCTTPLLTSYLRMGAQNDPEQVRKLQAFLNIEMGSGLEVNGIFDLATEAAVKAFQVKYASIVLAPWGTAQPTGYVYYTTQKAINEINCKYQTLFPLTAAQQAQIAQVKVNGLPAAPAAGSPAQQVTLPTTPNTDEDADASSGTQEAAAGASQSGQQGGSWWGGFWGWLTGH